MSEKSLLLEGASDVVLSLEEEGFLFRFLGGLVAVEESVDDRFMGSSLRDCRSCWMGQDKDFMTNGAVDLHCRDTMVD